MVTFPSRTLARSWAVACGAPVQEAGATVAGRPGAWSSVPGPAVQVSCQFCRHLGQCSGSPGQKSCQFQPSTWWPESRSTAPIQLSLFG